MQPQDVDVFVDVPPTFAHEPQPHGRRQQQELQPQPDEVFVPVEVPPTVPDEPDEFWHVQVHVQLGFVVDVPPTEPDDCLQQGLQQRCCTKSGKTMPLQLLQEEHIRKTS